MLGLVGNPVRHSLSPALFSRFFRKTGLKGSYELFELSEARQIPLLFKEREDLSGLNVTVPFKKQVMAFLDRLDASALEAGSVNVIKRSEDGRLAGYNTDVAGFEAALRPWLPLSPASALILGTGGAASAAAAVLRRQGIRATYVSRRASEENLAYSDLTPHLMSRIRLVVQATPCGMKGFPHAMPPFPPHLIHEKLVLIDLVYVPRKTPLMAAFRMRGARAAGGLRMLYVQALEAWYLFTGLRHAK